MDAKEMRSLSDQELTQALQDNLEELYNFRFQKAAERIENPGRVHAVRKNIARIKTVVQERSNS
jgi:large subunit ribosomal protein L29